MTYYCVPSSCHRADEVLWDRGDGVTTLGNMPSGGGPQIILPRFGVLWKPIVAKRVGMCAWVYARESTTEGMMRYNDRRVDGGFSR